MIKYLTKFAAEQARQIRAYFTNPVSHAREIIIVTAIFIVIILFAFNVYLYASAWRRTRRLPKARQVSRPFNWKLLITVTLVTGAIIASAGTVAPTRPVFCGACHRMKPAFKSWQASSHKKIGCMGCHQEPGVIGFVRSRTAGLRNLSLRSTYAGRFRPTRVLRLTNGACLKCHGRIEAKTVTAKSIRVSHREFAREISCTACHNGVGHRPLKQTTSATTTKRYCLNCHNGAIAGNDCGICHIDDIGGSPSGKGSMTTLDLGLKCDGCHSEDGCKRCHKPPPVPVDD